MPKQPVLYEAMYIVDSALDEAALEGIVSTLEQHVQNMGGELVATREFGRRRLAFEIDGHTAGTYMITYFKSFGDVVDEVKHEMHLIEGIVRGIVVVANPKAIFDPQAKAAEPEAAPAEAPAAEAPAAEAPAAEAPAAEAAAEPEAEAPETAPEAEAEAAPEADAGEAPAADEAPAEEA
ncbi:30S ribosomal protein S6 [bacterium]|nr:30S ribosomal protein S6 [bacterium]